MGGYVWAGEDRDRQAAEETLAAIRAIAAERTGWEPWMTDQVGYGASET